MDQVKPPTDSLYKFIAIFGLVLFLWSFYAVDRLVDSYMESAAFYAEKVDDPSGHKFAVIEKSVKGEEGGLDPFVQSLPQPERAPFLRLYRQTSKLSVTAEKLGYARGIGIIMIVLGFSFWYYKIQRHQDAILYRQATSDAKSSNNQQSD